MIGSSGRRQRKIAVLASKTAPSAANGAETAIFTATRPGRLAGLEANGRSGWAP
jgi:hypothetical protein